jgi:hypothetical protein
MIRIPNPGSDLDIFLRIFRDLYGELKDRRDFDLDDMTAAMIARGNVTSQGAIGQEALRRSTRPDRSRDPLYNQSKMYAELFRTLGWIQSTTSALRFVFSLLGLHVATAKSPNTLVRECLTGLAYPNDVLGVKGGQSIRIFTAILRAMAGLDGKISRDEMIVGPLSVDDDRDTDSFSKMTALISKARARTDGVVPLLAALGEKRSIAKTTMENYTRFPIAAIQWADWAEKRGGYFHLTDFGREEIARIVAATDVRLSDFRKFPEHARQPFIRLSFFEMLGRSNFDLTPVRERVESDRSELEKVRGLPHVHVLFSPFQQLSRDGVNAAFSEFIDTSKDSAATTFALEIDGTSAGRHVPLTTLLCEIGSEAVTTNSETEVLAHQLHLIFTAAGEDLDAAIETFALLYANANKEEFYPLVANFFRLLGLDCRTSRAGVNYERADAMIIDPLDSIPLEIKSPGEEMEISVKGVRQALENKLVLLSRKGYPTTQESTSLVIGFNPPNERSEVHELVSDIYKAFGIKLGVIDFRSLLKLALLSVTSGKRVVMPDFKAIKGVISVSRIATNR